MGEMKNEVLSELLRLNPSARPAEIAIYADAFCEYRAAQKNIDEHGSIVFHPRTGAPIENPYIRVRDKSSLIIQRLKTIKTGDLWGDSRVSGGR